MTTTTLANAIQTLQSDIVTILKADKTALSFSVDGETATQASTLSAMKIVDGMPSRLSKETSFPLIIVHTPESDGTRLTMTKHRIEMTIEIEIMDRREGNVRRLMDAVIDAIQNAQATTKRDGYWWFGRSMRTNISHAFLPFDEGGKPIWHASINLTYLWTGS